MLLAIGFIFVVISESFIMNYIDYIIIILLVISAVHGAVKGLVYEVASLVALIGGVWGAIKFSHATETFLVQRLNFTNPHIDIIAFVITFIIIIVVVHLIGKAVEKALETAALGTVNRILGLVFGVFKTLFILGVLVIVIEKLDESFPTIPENHIQESKFYNPLRNVAIQTFPFVQGIYHDIKGNPDDEKDTDDSDKKKNEKSGSKI